MLIEGFYGKNTKESILQGTVILNCLRAKRLRREGGKIDDVSGDEFGEGSKRSFFTLLEVLNYIESFRLPRLF